MLVQLPHMPALHYAGGGDLWAVSSHPAPAAAVPGTASYTNPTSKVVYTLDTRPATFDEAQTACATAGGHLASYSTVRSNGQDTRVPLADGTLLEVCTKSQQYAALAPHTQAAEQLDVEDWATNGAGLLIARYHGAYWIGLRADAFPDFYFVDPGRPSGASYTHWGKQVGRWRFWGLVLVATRGCVRLPLGDTQQSRSQAAPARAETIQHERACPPGGPVRCRQRDNCIRWLLGLVSGQLQHQGRSAVRAPAVDTT